MAILTLRIAFLLLIQVQAAQPGDQIVRPIGAILAVDVSAGRITIRTDAGAELQISFEAATRFLRVAPGAKDLQGAEPGSARDLAVGDRILARGRAGADGSYAASSIIVMSRDDVAQKRAAERTDWEKRGIGGIITAIRPDLRELTITRQTTAGASSTVITLAPGVVLRRYAPSSVKFSDARPGRFEELRVGDQVKARGNASEDHSRMAAEELVSGSFRSVAAVVTAIDAEKNAIHIKDLSTGRILQAQVTPDSGVHRLTPEVVRMLTARVTGANGTSGSRVPGPGSGDLASAIERLPRLSLTEMKPGETVLLAGSYGDDPARVTVITLLAGAEPILQSRSGKALDLGSWNLDLNMSAGVP